jgi:hypothetical protein
MFSGWSFSFVLNLFATLVVKGLGG